MSAAKRVLALVAVVAVAAVSGCSKRSEVRPGAGPSVQSRTVDAVVKGEDLPPEELKEPVPKTERERLIFKASQIYDFCQGWKVIEDIPEPKPDDPDDLVRFATRYYETLSYIDVSKKVLEQVRSRQTGAAGSKRVELSDEAKAELDALRRQAFAYLKRVVVTRAAAKEGLGEDSAQARYDDAFFQLSSDAAQDIYQRVSEYAHGHCAL